MFRRCVSISLILAYSASQWAAMPHLHAADADTHRHGEGALPHVHLSWFTGTGHSHRHSHRHVHCGKSNPKDCSETKEPAIVPNRGADHDADAVYLCDTTTLGRVKTASDRELGCDRLVVAVDSVAVASVLAGHASLPLRARSPNGSVGDCALYLKLRTLRI